MFRQTILENLPHLLEPVARLLVRHGIKFPELLAAFKQAYVTAAQKELALAREKESTSRLSAMTGLHRPDIKQLLQTSSRESRVDYLQRIVWRWQQDPAFSRTDGTGRVLSVQGTDSEFYKLVRSVNTALNPYTVLFELERSGQVVRTARGVRLAYSEFTGDGSVESGIEFLRKDLSDLIAVVDENGFGTRPPVNHHITTEYDRIPTSEANAVREWLFAAGNRLHREARQYLSDIESNSTHRSKEYMRVVLGSFGRVEEERG